MTSGIYAITNLITGRRYIGSSIDIETRWRVHKNDLYKNKHHAQYLQRSWNKYSESNFSFDILFECHKSECVFYEQLWIDFEGYDNLYNENPTAGNKLGAKHSEETKKKIGKSNTGKKRTDESRGRLQIAKNGYSVIQIDLEGKILGRWKFAKEAAKQTGFYFSSISSSVHQYTKCNGTMFVKYEKDIQLALQKNKEMCELQKINIKKSRSKPIYQIDMTTHQVIKKWDSTRDVERKLGINSGNISQCSLGKLKSAGGYIWRYVDDLIYEIGDIYNEKICLHKSAI